MNETLQCIFGLDRVYGERWMHGWISLKNFRRADKQVFIGWSVSGTRWKNRLDEVLSEGTDDAIVL